MQTEIHTDTDIEGFLIEPLDGHPGGLAAGISAASEEIAARVASWFEEVAAS